MLVPLRECPTSLLRKELATLELTTEGTRTQVIQRLSEHTPVVELEKAPFVELEKAREAPVMESEKGNERDYDPISPYIPIQTLERSGHILTDAAYTVLDCKHIRSVETLQVSNVDIVVEIEDIRELKRNLVQDYLALKRDLEHVRASLENTFNRDLYLYNVSKEITWNDLEQHIQMPGTAQLLNAQFFGKIEDTTIHATLTFEIQKDPFGIEDTFVINLPARYDARLGLCPIMALVHSNYDAGEYLSESTQCHAYIRADNPTQMTVFCPVLRDEYTRLRGTITMRYLATLDEGLITPARLSSMWYREGYSERNHRVYHHWTVMEDRVELFTNVVMESEMDGVDVVHVELPVPCSDDRYIDVVGYGVITYTIHGSNVIYSNNTPLVRISQKDTRTLQIKSSLMLNVNNYNSMTVATHIVYTRKVNQDLVYGLTTQEKFVKALQPVHVTFRTTVPVNAYYFKELRAVTEHGDTISISISKLDGLQTDWRFVWEVPEELAGRDTQIYFEIVLYDKMYRTTEPVTLVETVLDPADIDAYVDQVGTHDISLWLMGIETKYPIPHKVSVMLNSETQLIHESYTSLTEKLFVHPQNLVHNTDYTISLLFEDVIGRIVEKVIGTERTLGTGSMFYSIDVTQDIRGTVVTAKLLPSGDWTVFISETELVIDSIFEAQGSQGSQGSGSGEDVYYISDIASGWIYLIHEDHVQTVQF